MEPRGRVSLTPDAATPAHPERGQPANVRLLRNIAGEAGYAIAVGIVGCAAYLIVWFNRPYPYVDFGNSIMTAIIVRLQYSVGLFVLPAWLCFIVPKYLIRFPNWGERDPAYRLDRWFRSLADRVRLPIR